MFFNSFAAMALMFTSYIELKAMIPTAKLETIQEITALLREKNRDYTAYEMSDLLSSVIRRLIDLSNGIKL